VAQVLGPHAVAALLAEDPARVRALYAQKGRGDARLQGIVEQARAAGIRVSFVPRQQLDRRAEAPHQGVLAECHALAPMDEAAFEALWPELPRPLLLLVLDGVTDPRNLGACLRSAEAAGAGAVLWPRRRSAPLSEVALKAAAGAAEHLRLVEVVNLARALDRLKAAGLWVVGAADATTAAQAQLWNEVDLRGDCALVLGAEGSGLRRLTRERCDTLVSIPMAGRVSSLNVAVAAGVLLFEAVRQRRPGP